MLRDQKKSLTVRPVVVPRAHEVLASQLRDRILRREIPEGEALPTERDLVEQSGLTRSVVRDALRMLSVEGLIQTKPGRAGGSVVTLPSHEAMASAIYRFVQGRRISVRSLQETRELLEPFLARLAAERRTEEDVQELKELHEELVNSVNNFQDFTLANVKWHNAVAKASGNELLSTLLYSISHGVQLVTRSEEYDTPGTRKEVIEVHARVNQAIESRQPDAAEHAMRRHMTASRPHSLAALSAEVPLAEAIEAAQVPSKSPRRTRTTKTSKADIVHSEGG
jgi:GntR family transcriptional regulator, transcriptional repressor for pyruvate dehydrogenase complex